MSSVASELKQIYRAFQESSEWSHCVVDQTEGFLVESSFSFWDLLPIWLLKIFAPDWYRKQNRASLNYFVDTFGRKRVIEICRRMQINFDEIERLGMPLDRRAVSKLFLGVGNLHLDDIQTVFDFVVAEAPTRFGCAVERDARVALHRDFQGKSFEELTIEDHRRLHPFLVPAPEINTLFFEGVPTFKRGVFDSEYDELQRGIFVTEKIWRSGAALDEDEWRELMAKALVKRHQGQVGVVIPHPRDVFALYGRYDSETADVSFFESLTGATPSLVKFYGMGLSFRPNGILALKEGFDRPLGKKGFDRLEHALLYVLGRRDLPPLDFDACYSGIRNRPFRKGEEHRGFSALTYSMGGPFCMQAVMKHPGLFVNLSFVDSPGIELSQCEAFSKRREDGPMEIHHVLSPGDPTSLIGTRLGYKCTGGKVVTAAAVISEQVEEKTLRKQCLNPPPAPSGLIGRISAFMKGFSGPHWDDNTLITGLFTWAKWSNQNPSQQQDTDKILGQNLWESVRLDYQPHFVSS